MFVSDLFEPKPQVTTSTGGGGVILVHVGPEPASRAIIQTGTVTAEVQKLLKTQLESFNLIKPENYNVH